MNEDSLDYYFSDDYFDDEFATGERAARNAEGKTYYVPSDMTYKEWKAKQDEEPDLMSNSFRPRYEDKITDEKIEKTNIKTRRVENSKFDLYVDEDYADKRNKAVRNTERLLSEISNSIDTNTFEIGKVVLTDLGKIHKDFKNAIGMYNRLTDTIYINGKYDTNDKIIDYLNKDKNLFANNDKLTPLKHEMGHKFYEKCIKKLAKKENIDYNKAKDRIDSKIFEKVKELNLDSSELFLIDNLSEYAYNHYKNHKYTEVIAECLTVYKENSLANSIISELLED